jgi:dTMP kinase
MLISFEGLPGTGKSTQARLLAEHLGADGARVRSLPDLARLTTDDTGQRLSELFAISGDPFKRTGDVTTDTFLAAAIRANILATSIQPALDAGYIVIEDRGAHTMYSYTLAGILRHHHMDPQAAITWLKACSTLAGQEADISALLRLPPAQAAARVARRPGQAWNDEQRVFLGHVSKAYEHLEHADTRLIAINVEDLTPAEVHTAVYQLVTAHPDHTGQ